MENCEKLKNVTFYLNLNDFKAKNQRNKRFSS